MIDQMKKLTDLIADIRAELDGTVWTAETCETIAELLRKAGYPVRDIADEMEE